MRSSTTLTELEIAHALRSTASWTRTVREHPDDVCTGDLAVDEHGVGVSPGGSEAVRWCALGHLQRELRVDESQLGWLIRQRDWNSVRIYTSFDSGHIGDVARVLETYASELEAMIAEAPEVEARGESLVSS